MGSGLSEKVAALKLKKARKLAERQRVAFGFQFVGTVAMTPAEWTMAIEEASATGANVAGVAHKWHVPRPTLIARMKKGCVDLHKTGRKPVLTKAVEDKLVDYIIHMADAGFPLTAENVKTMARSAAREVGMLASDFNGGNDWYYAFRRRYPEISSRVPNKVNGARMAGFNRIIVAKWMTMVEPILAQYTPEEIFNADDKHLNPEEILNRKVSKFQCT